MPTASHELVGLDQLISVCRRHSLPLELAPPLPSAPREGDLLLGDPLDPQLAAVYRRLGGATLGPLSLYRPGDGWDDLHPWNQRLRERDPVHYDSCLLFGEKTGFALYLATVPRLASPEGLQPVVYVEAMDTLSAVPVASSVDRFFSVYSRYLERMVVDLEYIHTGVPELLFPWSIPELIAGDAPLLNQIRGGHFDFLTHDDPSAMEWLRELQAAGR